MPSCRRSLAAAAFAVSILLGASTPALAQVRPTPEQAQALLRDRPELLAQLRERLATSGLSPAQVRARLKAEGYPETLLDAYLGRGSSENAAPTTQVFEAMRDLGLTDDADLAELRRLAGLPSEESPARELPRKLRVDSAAIRDSTLSLASGEIFGLSLFRSSTSQFMPNVDGPVDANYRVGPGDQLVLILTGDVEELYTLDVARDGTVRIPEVGPLAVANLSLAEIDRLARARLARVYSSLRADDGGSTRLSVSVAKLRSNQVFVAGDVMAPGSYRVTSAGTALTALYAAGGPTDGGSLRTVEVRRAGKVVATLDVYDYLLRGDGTHDVRLQQGDVVFVPLHGGRVRVDGEVARPATYELKSGETVAGIIAAAGGLNATATGRRIYVERILPRGDRTLGRSRVVVDVPLSADGAVPPLPVADGDVVRVPRVGLRVRGKIKVSGHVWTPGIQGHTAGLTLSEALARAGGLKPDAYLGAALVSRLLPDSTRTQLRQMLRDSTGATIAPLLLQEDDEITVYSRTEFRPERYVVIGGAVRRGGRFPYRDGMTLRDLTLMAGGLLENAYLREAEIARIPLQRSARVTANTLRVPLDSAYRFDLATSPATAADVTLLPYDNVLILQDPEWRAPQSVLLTGEVRFPGRYTLLSRGERLSAVLKRAGGLTEEANADGAYFARLVDTAVTRDLRAAARRGLVSGTRQELDADTAGTPRDSTGNELSRLDGVGPRIRVGLDLRAAVRAPGGSDDLLMLNGDSVHVPLQRQTVDVRGGVNAPTALAHNRGRRLEYYVNAAGGPTDLARSRRTYVIQPNGKIQSRRHLLWIIPLDPTPLPGATVVVPEREKTQGNSNTLATVALVTQLIASLAAVFALTR